MLGIMEYAQGAQWKKVNMSKNTRLFIVGIILIFLALIALWGVMQHETNIIQGGGQSPVFSALGAFINGRTYTAIITKGGADNPIGSYYPKAYRVGDYYYIYGKTTKILVTRVLTAGATLEMYQALNQIEETYLTEKGLLKDKQSTDMKDFLAEQAGERADLEARLQEWIADALIGIGYDSPPPADQ